MPGPALNSSKTKATVKKKPSTAVEKSPSLSLKSMHRVIKKLAAPQEELFKMVHLDKEMRVESR